MALILCGNFFLSALLAAMDLLEHKMLLKEYCRVFGGKLGRQSYGTLEYATELQNIWCIAVEEESPDIFPQKFCHKCKCALNRGVSGRLAVLWFSHPRNRHCSVCDHFKNQKKGGRPRKIGFRGQKTLSARFSAVEEKKVPEETSTAPNASSTPATSYLPSNGNAASSDSSATLASSIRAPISQPLTSEEEEALTNMWRRKAHKQHSTTAIQLKTGSQVLFYFFTVVANS